MPASSLGLLIRQSAGLSGQLPCRREDLRLWFSDVPAELEVAKVHCQACPVRIACLAGALERREPYGVWGGEIFERGTITAHKRPRGRPPRTARSPACIR